MSFAALSPTAVALGAVVLAALLFALQHLRARRRIVRLPTALLWREAVRDVPLRALGGRFRYLIGYLVALAIVLLLWLAFARPEPVATRSTGFRHYYLDASAAMTGGDRFDAARRALIADVRAAPIEARDVYLGDAFDTRVLAAGEDPALLARRLAGVSAGAAPSGLADWIGGVARRGGVVRFYGAPAVAGQVTGRLAAATGFSAGYLSAPVVANRGIVAFGASPAASGRWDRADALVTTAATDGRAPGPGELRFTLDGRSFTPARVAVPGPGRLLLRDVPAEGGELRVALRGGDDMPADDGAALRLADHRRVRVAVGAGVPAAIAAVVRFDDALVPSAPDTADVVIRRAGDRDGGDRPALELVGTDRQPATFVFTQPGTARDDDVAASLDRLGLSQVDAAGLADRLGRPIAVEVTAGPRRRVSVWADLFAADASFTRSRAMPLFVSQSVRWLAGTRPWIAYAAAGRELYDEARLNGSGTGDPVYLPMAGEVQANGTPLAVSLTDRATTLAHGAPARLAVTPGDGGSIDLWLTLLIVAAAIVLAVEWHLHRRGVMP